LTPPAFTSAKSTSTGPRALSRPLQPISWTPRRAVLALMAAQLVLWTLVPFLTHYTMPLDVVREGLAWGVEWQWGYHKHPPLATWLVDASFRLLGDLGPYLLSQIAIVATYGFVFLLGRRLMGEAEAAIGTLLLVGVYYFSWPTPEFNHNVAQMPFWAAAAYLFHRAVREDRLVWWLSLGAVAGAGLLVKYSTAVLLAVMAVYVVGGARTRRLLLTPRPYAGLAVMTAVLLPHVAWLVDHDFAPFRYLEERSATDRPVLVTRIVEPAAFLLTQAADHLPMLLLLGAAGLIGRPARQAASTGPAVTAAEDRRFLVTLGLGPALLAASAALLLGVGLRDMWGAPMFNLSGLLAVHLLAGRLRFFNPHRFAVAIAALLVLVAIVYGAVALFGSALSGRPKRIDWPDLALASTLEKVWRERTGCPLRIVAGDGWLAGLVSLRAAGRPAVLLDGELAFSPWITPDRLRREGALLVWRIERGETGIPAPLTWLGAAQAEEPLALPWPRAPRVSPLRVGWAIRAPSACG
jgi:4-amino-4-deoxy-L-arabinose transferase-like glycosyltransferase